MDRILRKSWNRTWSGLGIEDGRPDLYSKLLAAYREPQRHYHNDVHLAECLGLFDNYRHIALAPFAVECALWFHDAVYDVHAHDNEEKSAQWAADELRKCGVSSVIIDNVVRLIMTTKHNTPPISSDEMLIVDVDLSILGASEERFREYEAQIREEYSWVADDIFQTKRREMLSSFEHRFPIFYHEPLRFKFEAQARQNLMRSIKLLTE